VAELLLDRRSGFALDAFYSAKHFGVFPARDDPVHLLAADHVGFGVETLTFGQRDQLFVSVRPDPGTDSEVAACLGGVLRGFRVDLIRQRLRAAARQQVFALVVLAAAVPMGGLVMLAGPVPDTGQRCSQRQSFGRPSNANGMTSPSM